MFLTVIEGSEPVCIKLQYDSVVKIYSDINFDGRE